MGIIVVLLIWYFVAARNNPKLFRKIKSGKRKWIPILISIALISGLKPTLLYFTIALGIIALPIYVIYRIFRALIPPSKQSGDEYTYTTHKQRNEEIPKAQQLPLAVPKRIRIVSKFNDKYGLNLTESQIQTIVDASYISTDWEMFIQSMTKEYQTIYQWYNTPSGSWLRIYLRVFNTQTISPDMKQQKQICLDSFSQIFHHTDLSAYNTPSWDIRDVNNMFMTNFDDTTFMLAYRFLEENGIKYRLGKVSVYSVNDELEQLKEKYNENANRASR